MKVNKDNIECMIGKCFKNEDEDGFAKIVELLNKEEEILRIVYVGTGNDYFGIAIMEDNIDSIDDEDKEIPEAEFRTEYDKVIKKLQHFTAL